MADFNDNTPDLPGGKFGLIPPKTPEIRREGLRTICTMLNSVGLTSVHDARVIQEELTTYPHIKKGTKTAS